MKLKGYLGRSDGQVSGPLAGLVVGVVILFVGLFMVAVVEPIIPNTDSNVFSTASNTTAILTGMPGNDTYALTIGATVLDQSETLLEVGIINNTDPTLGAVNINVSLNRVAVSNVAMPAQSSLTNISVTILNGTVNNVSFGNETGFGPNETTITNATIYYVSSTTRTSIGVISDATVVTTGTIFSVLGLVIIVIALALAIQSLSGAAKPIR